jgi:hypothetical protein
VVYFLKIKLFFLLVYNKFLFMKKLIIRLSRQGNKKNSFFIIIVTEKRLRAKTGKVYERVGFFHPVYPTVIKNVEFSFQNLNLSTIIPQKLFFVNLKRVSY